MGKIGRPKDTDKSVFCCRDGDLRIVYTEATDAWELFDLATDPAETDNLIGSHPRADELKRKLSEHINRERS